MIEIPEAAVLSRQITEVLAGKSIVSVAAKQSPHKFAWFYGDTDDYDRLMRGRRIEGAVAVGSFVEVRAGKTRALFSEGINLRFHDSDATLPGKHQLLIGFKGGGYLCASVQMYGGMGCFTAGENDNPYYLLAQEKPAVGAKGFSYAYFRKLVREVSLQKKSAKAVLATEQRIPGLGNGVLQDVLYNARIHPKRKLGTVDDGVLRGLYDSIRTTLAAMTDAGGRDTENDLFGRPGGYVTKCSKNTVGAPCPRCGEAIEKKSYMGGSVYYCPGCQSE